jgi:hypothetical protein
MSRHSIDEIKKYAANLLKAKVMTIGDHADRMFPTAGDVEFASRILNVTPVQEPKYVSFEEAKSLFSGDFITDYTFEGVSDTVYLAFQKVLDSLIAIHLQQLDLPLAYKANGTTLHFPIFGLRPGYGLPEYMAHHMATDNKYDEDWALDGDYDSEDADIMEEDPEKVQDVAQGVLVRGQEVTYYRDGTPHLAKILNVHYESPPPYYTIQVVLDGEMTERQTVRDKLVA